MPPPPPASMPLAHRLLALAQTLQFGWFIGHCTLLFCTLRYGLSYITFNYYSRWARLSYRTAFIAAAATYSIVVYKAYRAKMRANKGQSVQGLVGSLLVDENVQYLLMALVWLFSRQVPLSLLPFSIYSVFHVATYTRSNLIPTIQPSAPTTAGGKKPPASRVSEMIGNFVKSHYDASMTIVAGLEIALWFRLLLGALTFSKGSWVLLLVYTVFARCRYSQSSFVQGAFHHTAARVDAVLADQSIPPAVRNAWATVKGAVRSAADATDLRRYLGPPQAQGPKKAS